MQKLLSRLLHEELFTLIDKLTFRFMIFINFGT